MRENTEKTVTEIPPVFAEAADELRVSHPEISSVNIEPVEAKCAFVFRVTCNQETGEDYMSKLEKDIKKILEPDVEVLQRWGSGMYSAEWKVALKSVNGRINWRRWIPYPESISSEAEQLLDELAGFSELKKIVDSVSGDSLHKFYVFFTTGKTLGLITAEEERVIDSQRYHAANP